MTLDNEDIQKLITVFATKQELKELKEDLIEKMVTKDEFRQAFGSLDKVVGELQTIRQEFSAHRLEHEDTNDRLDAIESIPVVAHELKKKKSS